MGKEAAKKLTALICSASMIFCAAAPAAADPAEHSIVAEEAGEQVSQIDLLLGNEREWEWIKKNGKSIDEWDEEISLMKQEGTEDALTEEALLEIDPQTRILRLEDKVYYIGPNAGMGQVTGPQEAYRLIYRLLGLLGGTLNTDLRLWNILTVNDRTIYVFDQVSDSQGVPGSVVKLVVEENGDVSAVFSSLDTESSKEEKLVSREEAETAVLSRLSQEGIKTGICEGMTQRLIHTPLGMADLPITDEEEEDVPDQILWVVYSGSEDEENPYLAHYLKLDGTYLYSLPVKEPGDKEARCGYKIQPVFEGLTAAEWTGELTDINGGTHTVTVPVMYSEENERWYLGSLERGIAVCDYAAAAYDEEHPLKLVESKDNQDWDNDDLYMLYNYIKAWDFYAGLGWEGPDGEGTDVIILKDLCTEDGTPYLNACSIGRVEGWQMFGYTSQDAQGNPLGLVRALDVMAHEYTHTFTGTVMVNNLYVNDMGAINEAMSDIMGNIVEQICGETDDTTWLLGENTGNVIRSMSYPNDYSQPSHVWDVYYGPEVDEMSTANDRGGVHVNSSLLNRIAAMLCIEYGMTLEEAASFWITTACGMTPGTDYPRMEALLGWALEASGNQKHDGDLDALIEEEKLNQTELPRELRLGRKLMKLKLPDTEAFADPNWALVSIQLNKEKMNYLLGTFIRAGYRMIKDKGELTRVAAVVNELIDHMHLDGRNLKLDAMENMDEDELIDTVLSILSDSAKRIIVQSLSWEMGDSGEIVFVQESYPTFYVLINIRDAGTRVNGMAVLLGSQWYDIGPLSKQEKPEEEAEIQLADIAQLVQDLGRLARTIAENKGNDVPSLAEMAESRLTRKVDRALRIADLIIDGIDVVSDVIEGNEVSLDELLNFPTTVEYLPVAGLEDVQLIEK